MDPEFKFNKITNEQIDFDALENTSKTDPLALLERCRKRHRAVAKGTRRLRWEMNVACYASALAIRNKPELFDKLMAHETFEGRTYKANIHDVLRLAMLVGTDAALEGPTYKNACYIAHQLQPLFDEDATPECALKAIEEARGFKGLRESESTDIDQGAVVGSVDKNVTLTAKRLQSAAVLKKSPFGGSSARASSPFRLKPAESGSEETDQGEVILEVIVTDAQLAQILENSRGKTTIVVEHIPSDTDWHRIKALSVSLLDKTSLA